MPPQKPAAPAGDTTGTITGQVRLDAGADQEVHTGQVQLGQQPQPAESTSDFALDFLDNQVEQRPDTEQFVRGIAQTLNTIPDTEDSQTGRYAEAAQRLTHAESEDGEEPGAGPTAAKSTAPGWPARRWDEREPEPEGPFAQQQGHHKLDYETTDDAPRVRQELDKQVLYRTVAVIVSARGPRWYCCIWALRRCRPACRCPACWLPALPPGRARPPWPPPAPPLRRC